AAELLRCLLGGQPAEQPGGQERSGRADEQDTLLPHCADAVPSPRGAEADTVTTASAAANRSSSVAEGEDGDVAALESAIELATSLGVDTCPAEEEAAAVRGLLSLRVVWGTFIRFFLVPLGVSFDALMEEIARRFGLGPVVQQPSRPRTSHQEGRAPLARFPFELSCREGVQVRSRASWEALLRRRGLHARPGRVELRLEVAPSMLPLAAAARGGAASAAGGPAPGAAPPLPFVVTGTRLSPEPSRPPAPSPGLPRPSTSSAATRASARGCGMGRAGGSAVAKGRQRTTQQRTALGADAAAAGGWGCPAAAVAEAGAAGALCRDGGAAGLSLESLHNYPGETKDDLHAAIDRVGQQVKRELALKIIKREPRGELSSGCKGSVKVTPLPGGDPPQLHYSSANMAEVRLDKNAVAEKLAGCFAKPPQTEPLQLLFWNIRSLFYHEVSMRSRKLSYLAKYIRAGSI
ncbi:unnamed protein product, partial [Prorocentrum cordatum]